MLRNLCCFAVTVVLFGGCSNDVSSDVTIDAAFVDASVDASVDAPVDASLGIPLGIKCDPLIEQCQDQLTCRIQGAGDGRCLPVGTTAEGDICGSTTECGPNMTCLPSLTELGLFRCVVVCDVTGLVGSRCTESQRCGPYWSNNVGFCQQQPS